MKKAYCCDSFESEDNIPQAGYGGEGGFVVDNSKGEVNVAGCEMCYVLQEIKFCPYCGKEIKFI